MGRRNARPAHDHHGRVRTPRAKPTRLESFANHWHAFFNYLTEYPVILRTALEPVLKAVFDVEAGWQYRGDLPRRHDFVVVEKNLMVAASSLNDWVAIREKRRGGSDGTYIGIGRVAAVHAAAPGSRMASADIVDFLAFLEPVPLQVRGRYVESRFLAVLQPRQIGAAFMRQQMRVLFDGDFAAMIRHGFGSDLPLSCLLDARGVRGFQDSDDVPTSTMRDIEEVLLKRPFRDPVFRKLVGEAFGFTCALTGWRHSDGLGRFEVEAAHLRPVAEHGPDDVYNGLCLSRTVHWLVDCYLASINLDYTLVTVSELIEPGLRDAIVSPGSRIHLPHDQRLWPHARYIERHRSTFRRRRGF